MQYQAYGSLSHYLGPDRLNASYVYTRQNIDPSPYLERRDREMIGATVDYQIFRPLRLPDRNANSGFERHFETRGIDVLAGFLADHDRYYGPTGDVIARHDYFVGLAAHGLGRVDVSVQPTWYTPLASIPIQHKTIHNFGWLAMR